MSVYSLLEKLTQIKDNEPIIFETGYNTGFAEGKAEGGGSSGVDVERINVALDEAVALQKSFLPELLTFTFNEYGTLHTLEFEEGMTWGEWCNSEYNTVGLYINEEQGNAVYYSVSAVRDETDYNTLYDSSNIEANHTFIIV